MTGKWKPKPKKVIETSLGKAPKEEKPPDLSHLRKPITTSISGLKQLMSLFQTATLEVQDYISYECDVLYECKICRTIFRSLANFILHKRNYCRDKWQFGGGNTDGGFVINDDLKTSDEESRSATPVHDAFDANSNLKKNDKKEILPIIDKLLKKQKVDVLAKKALNEDLSTKNDASDDDVIFVSEEASVVLQKIDSSKAAVFQTAVRDLKEKEELIKLQVLEVHDILDNNQAAIGSNGKVCNFSTNQLSDLNAPKKNLTCSECNFTFSTEKTLTHHIKYKHNKTCIVFPCPDCKETFSNAWSVYRHLYKVHRRTTSQIRRMRYLVHSSGIRKDQEPEKKKRKLNPESDDNEENQWMHNFEGDKDFQMCGGCGKRFERKAALHSHSQMCTKRKDICNSIKNVKATVKNDNKKITEKVETIDKPMRGAAKRKQTTPVIIKGKSDSQKPVELKPVEGSGNPGGPEPVKILLPEDPNPEVPTSDQVKPEDAPFETITITKAVDDDVTITKGSDVSESSDPLALPEIEIFTISDDSNDCDEAKMALKQKRHLWDFDVTSIDLPEDFKDCANDNEDLCFLAKMMSYIDRDELRCISCDNNFMSLYVLLRHMSLHFSWYRYQCSKCNFMSFHKYDCSTHAYETHGTPNNLMDSTVLPIPKWKVLCTSHDFSKIQDNYDSDSNNDAMPRLEPMDHKFIDEKEKLMENGAETIILEDDEMPNICTENPYSDTVVVSDDETRDSITTPEKKKIVKAGPSVANDRPIRNRTKSFKTVQNDFIYDLAKVLKCHDSKSKKVKKSPTKV